MSPSIYHSYPTETLERWAAACTRAGEHAEASVILSVIAARDTQEKAA